MTINTFLRPDSSMINLLINNVIGSIGVRVVENHRFIATVRVTPATEAFAKLNPTAVEMANAPSYFGGYEVMEIGVSLSQITSGEFARMTRRNMGKSITQFLSASVVVPNGYVGVPFVPGLYTNGKDSYTWVNVTTYTDVEQQYAALFEGFDFFYDYSDSHSVYSTYNTRLKENDAMGRSLGLSTVRMNEIYRQLSGR